MGSCSKGIDTFLLPDTFVKHCDGGLPYMDSRSKNELGHSWEGLWYGLIPGWCWQSSEFIGWGNFTLNLYACFLTCIFLCVCVCVCATRN